ncbi:unnamed protein product [Mytilus coruscus]|uniref:Uncharacterized protein n=1 Tax=Mytilus coruscus TaxID=42192 RepID=A0A6J8DJR6_MYTCO|nr:unnamed protein product [Mytilus coruscus]
MTPRKFYGSHFHSLVVHLPEIYRIINTKSILAEQEERTFGSLRRLAEGTTNRKPGWIVDNTILRFNCQQTENSICSFSKQNSVISQQSKLLSKRENTIFPKEIFGIKSSLFQSHLERIADFLLPGYNIWWHYNGTEIVFHDSVDEPEFRMQGPDTANFRSTSLKKERAIIDDIWQTSLDKAASSELVLPILHVKTKEDGKLIYKRTNLKSVMKHVSSPTNNISEDETNDNLEETAQKETNQVSRELALLNPINFIPDDDSESTEDYIPNIPIVQGNNHQSTSNRPREKTPGRQGKQGKVQIITLKFLDGLQPTCSKIDVHESLFNKPNKLPANRAKTPLRCKRKIFASEVSKQEIASCRKKTTLDMVVQLLGPSSDVDDCLKYRELKLKHPGHKSFISAFDQSFSKLQIEVSKRYFALKEETTKDDGKENRENLLADKEIAQKLLGHWGMYYF